MRIKHVPTTDINFYQGHRERLRAKFLAGQISEAEFVELLLTYVIPRRDVRPLARALMNRYSGLLNITSAPIKELITFPGLGQRSAEFFKCLAHATTLQYHEIMSDKPVFSGIDILINYCKMLLANKPKEEVHVLYLDHNFQLKETGVHTLGTRNESQVYTRDIVAHAYGIEAQAVVLAHNHPNGTPVFSVDDLITTKELAVMLHSMGMQLYDHILIAKGTAISARNAGILPLKETTSNPQHHKPALTEPAE